MEWPAFLEEDRIRACRQEVAVALDRPCPVAVEEVEDHPYLKFEMSLLFFCLQKRNIRLIANTTWHRWWRRPSKHTRHRRRWWTAHSGHRRRWWSARSGKHARQRRRWWTAHSGHRRRGWSRCGCVHSEDGWRWFGHWTFSRTEKVFKFVDALTGVCQFGFVFLFRH